MGIQNFLFDLYGTLVDVHTDEDSPAFWADIAAMLRVDASRLRERFRTLCAEEYSMDKETQLSKIFTELLREYGSTENVLAFARRFRARSIVKLRLFEGASELLDGLRARDAGVYLLSNAQACFTRPELEILGLTDKFDGIHLSSEAGWKKPCEKFFLTAFERFSLSPETCIYIGNDLRDDIGGARAVGMRSVYIETEQSGRYENQPPVDLRARDHQELALMLFRLAEEGALGKNLR